MISDDELQKDRTILGNMAQKLIANVSVAFWTSQVHNATSQQNRKVRSD